MKNKPQNIEELREYVAELETRNKAQADLIEAQKERMEELETGLEHAKDENAFLNNKINEAEKLAEGRNLELLRLQDEFNGLKAEQKPYTLLKSRVQKDGKTYDNLYILVGDGSKYAPIAIQLTRWNPKQKNLLLVHAKPASIRRVTLVQNLDKPSASLVEEGAPATADHKVGDGDLF